MHDELRAVRDVAAPDGVERNFGLRGVLAALGVRRDPIRCGRYELREKLGEGAMGVVYHAHDPELDRWVAVKLLREPSDDETRDVLREEGRALARLSHPNVVQVLGVGREQGRTWIAMEWVEGTTLAQWATAHPPGTAQRHATALRMLLAAGRGLHAAHVAGLVHRDFKPANVLVRGRDQLVKVADFGLARPQLMAETLESPYQASARAELVDDLSHVSRGLTRTGAIVGTPRYMSPEQHMGQLADARSDQFCFAVSAWEVFYGSPPFSARTANGVLDAIERGELPVPDTDAVPSGVRDVLARALAADPQARYPSMGELLRELGRRRRGLGLITLGLVAAGMTVWWAAGGDASLAAAGPRCDRGEAQAEVTRVWSDARREAVTGAMSATNLAYADSVGHAVDGALREFSTRWVDAQVEACRATWHLGDASEADLDARVACLQRQLDTADAFVARLEDADAELVEHAAGAAHDLPTPEACRHPESIPSAEDSPRAAELRAELDVAAAAQLAADYRTAKARAGAVAAAAGDAGLDVLKGDALEVLARALGELAEPSAGTIFEQAYEIAIAHDHPARATERARRAATFYIVDGKIDEGAQWLRHAEAANERQGRPKVATAYIERTRCQLQHQRGEIAAAYDTCTTALASLDGAAASDLYLRWSVRTRLATLAVAMGRTNEAIEIDTQLREEAEAELGPSHPRVGGMWLNLGKAAQDTGRADLAEESYRRAIDVFRVAYGPDHRWVVSGWMNLGSLYLDLHRLDESEVAFAAALQATAGREDAVTARVLHNFAELRRRQSRDEEALKLLERVRVIEADTLPPDHPQLAHTHQTLGTTYISLGRLDDAQTHYDAALKLRDPDVASLDLARLWSSYAALAEARGDPETALQYSLRSLQTFAATVAGPGPSRAERGRACDLLLNAGRVDEARRHAPDMDDSPLPTTDRARFTYARMLYCTARVARLDGDPTRAQASAATALDALDGLSEPRAVDLRSTIEAWAESGATSAR
jgi:tetratricopeptide (TPR) repeat protein